ncbi:hypothetical protein [Citrobacter braakii]|uniref:hypothetical protein n=1 Tax=Citrobacter braakii TaxID=57706 RepID=UPI002DBF8E23|nr:hypothetical protein [Citrobacter braakii]MEB8013724.1 hypothetical protein [Citrobacter braakii]
MEQIKSYVDSRLLNGCIYCGGFADTREHVPSKVFLDIPYPENLPVVDACLACNNGFSSDEEYFSAFIEVAYSGTTDLQKIRREKIAMLLKRSPALSARILNAIVISSSKIEFHMELERIKRVIVKLARGHAAFELGECCSHEPSYIWWGDLNLLGEEQRKEFCAPTKIDLLGEIGSRHSRRIDVVELSLCDVDERNLKKISIFINHWIEVQENRYRYISDIIDGGVRIKMIIGGYFACEVTWS